MEYKVFGKQQEIVTEKKGEVRVEMGMFALWFSPSSVSVLPTSLNLSPAAFNSDYIFRGGDVKDSIRDVLKKSIQQVIDFDKEKALEELKDALTRVDEIAALYEQGEAK